MQVTIRKAEQIFRRLGGLLRTSKALALGVHPRTLYELRDSGRVVEVSRGVYRLANLGEIEDPDLVTVAIRVPKAVICLISALHFHKITTQIPHAVDVAVRRGTKPPVSIIPQFGSSGSPRRPWLLELKLTR
jgi:predicted transcriptional regulator of viral defense system